MTEMSKDIMIKRWETMANSEKLDWNDRCVAREIAEMARMIFENGVYRKPVWLAPIIRGYIINARPDTEDFYFAECLDLSGIDRFDKYLMIYTGWVEKYWTAIGVR